MHHFVGSGDIRPTAAFPQHSSGYRRFVLSDVRCGAVHSGWGFCELDAGGQVDPHVLSYEKSFYVLEGNPVLELDDIAWQLSPGDSGLIPVRMKHTWYGPKAGTAKWVDMNAPVASGENFVDETWFVGTAPQPPSTTATPGVSACEYIVAAANAVDGTEDFPVGEGVAVNMLVSEKSKAALHNMFTVEYAPGSFVDPHDHPVEEAYFVLEGEVEAHADGQTYLMKAGDFLWAGVRSTHAFYNRSSANVRWLETQSPQLPVRDGWRFLRDWQDLPDGD